MNASEKPHKASKRDPEGVKRDIVRVASKMFAEYGLSGARIDEIADQTKTSKRMIYYYFGDKDGLYRTCLETAYTEVRDGENKLDLGDLSPRQALERLVAFTFDHHRKNPEFIRMVMIENIHYAAFLSKSELIHQLNVAAIDKLSDIIQRGQKSGAFRADLDPIELHWQISALSFFNVSNKPTFSALFGDDLFSDSRQNAIRDQTVEMILRYVDNSKETSK